MEKYDHRAIETKWVRRWAETGAFETDLRGAEKPYYNLMMFPYPSAEGLHVGNVFAFVGSDIHGRYMRARGHDVFEPMGFDAFGIHSENFAIKINTHPAKLIPSNIRTFTEQLKRLGGLFDWSHQVSTTDPAYYRWTQWIFVQLYRAGLAYQKEAPVNWCPSCNTVLAAEQAEGGVCERCGTSVEQRAMRQWFFRITAYAQQLLDNLAWIDWSEITKNAQERWIGRSEGAEVDFPVVGHPDTLRVFTTRPDTLWGATYMVLAPEHPLVERVTTPDRQAAVQAYLQAAARKTDLEREDATREKTGVFTGGYAINPVNGERIPIWVSDYVLITYGTGAIMAVPAHDTRDFAFATAFRLPIVRVISPDGADGEVTEAYVGEGTMINSGPFNGMHSLAAKSKVTDWLEERRMGARKVNYRLRDWCISRQRYWGPPIPMIYCDRCGVVPVPEDQLPVVLPYIEDFKPDGSGKSPLARDPAFVATACPSCGGPGRRETDVNDNFLDSAWYFFRYPSADREEVVFDPALTEKWLPVDMYIGGNEHAVLHLMYTRFITMALKDMGLISFEEPFKRFRAHGLLIKDGAKMSKSKGNVVNPDEYLEEFGADTFRTYLMFLGPYQEGGDFRDAGINGVRRFYDRLWRYGTQTAFSDAPVTDRRLLALLHRKTKDVTQDLEALQYNTAIARLMELLNGLQDHASHHREAFRRLLQLASPFAPFIAQELWSRLGEEGLICDAPWPAWDETLIVEETIEYVVQVNGKVRDRLLLPPGTPQQEVEKAALVSERVHPWTQGHQVAKMIFVPNRLLNIVVR
jgi:leucyl-tRNA synthetase